MLKFKEIIIWGLILFFMVGRVFAQQSKVTAARNFLQEDRLDSAKSNIDAAIHNPETELNGYTWYIRGFIYKTIYNKQEKENKQSSARLEALTSFKQSMILDTAAENVLENIKNLKYLGTTLYNDAASSLDTINYKIAVNDFDIFREYYFLVDPSKSNFNQKELEFSNAIAAVYTQLYETKRSDRDAFLELAKASYIRVLSINPNNVTANYNMGILYYNQAVNLINQSDYDIDIVTLNDIQDNSIVLFKASLPFMEKAYALDPNRKETLLGLSGIYFGLNENEKSMEFKQKLEQIGK